MKISAINVNNYHVVNKKHSNNANFKGLLISKGSDSNSWDYQGEISGSSTNGHYAGSIDTDNYTYHPFKDEPEYKIEKALKDNSYSTSGDAGGFCYTTTCITERGKTIPFTEREWNNLSEEMKEKFKQML